jgi:protein-S-isoprenylcysteine O-methyltransferase Ste14
VTQLEKFAGWQARGLTWVLIQVVLLGVIALIPPDLLPRLPEPLWIVGLFVVGAGFLLVGVSAMFLGANLTIFPYPKKDGKLTQRGVYGLVRHPMYGGVLLCALGWSLLRTSLPSLLCSLVLGIFFDRKATREEIWLATKYPNYDDYRRRVRKLIPWLY